MQRAQSYAEGTAWCRIEVQGASLDGEWLGDITDFPRHDFLSQVPTGITSADSLMLFLVSNGG